MFSCATYALLVLCLLVGAAGYRDGPGFDTPSQSSVVELRSGGAFVKHQSPTHGTHGKSSPPNPVEDVDGEESIIPGEGGPKPTTEPSADEVPGESPKEMEEMPKDTDVPPDQPAEVPQQADESLDSPQGDSGEEDCTVELVPHRRLVDFQTQLDTYLKNMVKNTVNKVSEQDIAHNQDVQDMREVMTRRADDTHNNLLKLIHGFTIEQQRLMIVTRHAISGMCCCDTNLDKDGSGKLDITEIDAHFDSKNMDVCSWIPRNLKEGDLKLDGERQDLCPEKMKWQYRDIIGSGAKITSRMADKIIDDCIDSKYWYAFVEGKKPHIAAAVKKLTEQRRGQAGGSMDAEQPAADEDMGSEVPPQIPTAQHRMR